MKKFISVLVLFGLIASAPFCNLSLSATAINATTPTAKPISQEEVVSNTKLIEKELLCRNTDVITELEKQISRYEDLLLKAEADDTQKIENLIATTEELIDNYKAYNNATSARGIYDVIFSPAIAIALAFFNSSGYDLAAELLTHATDNENLDSIYTPVLGNDVLSSSIFTSIKNGSIYEGTASFPNSGTTNDIDLYYALHAFYYTKSESNRVVVIQDRYDFATSGYDSIGEIVVSTMYAAQVAGVIVPFYTMITQNFDGTASNQSEIVNIYSSQRYYEKKVTLGRGECKDFYVAFTESGTKVFQTFGFHDAWLYLYDTFDNLLVSSHYDGYSLNGFLTFYCHSYMRYRIRVRFGSTMSSGETKLVITPATGAINSESTSLDTYEDIYNTSSSNFAFSTYFTSGYVQLLTYTPSETRDYTIETESDIDTYLYLIDPRSTYNLTNGEGYDDDSGEGLNASICRQLSANVPYLIVYSRYSLTADDANLKLKIYAS